MTIAICYSSYIISIFVICGYYQFKTIKLSTYKISELIHMVSRAAWQKNIKSNVLIIIIPNCSILGIITFTNFQFTTVLFYTHNFSQVSNFCVDIMFFWHFISHICNIKAQLDYLELVSIMFSNNEDNNYAHPVICPMFCCRGEQIFCNVSKVPYSYLVIVMKYIYVLM